jgi:hypothetical protein
VDQHCSESESTAFHLADELEQTRSEGNGWAEVGGRLLLKMSLEDVCCFQEELESQARVKELLQQAAMVGYGSLRDSSLDGKAVAAEKVPLVFQLEGRQGAAG